jgi:hypothetical protein
LILLKISYRNTIIFLKGNCVGITQIIMVLLLQES